MKKSIQAFGKWTERELTCPLFQTGGDPPEWQEARGAPRPDRGPSLAPWRTLILSVKVKQVQCKKQNDHTSITVVQVPEGDTLYGPSGGAEK